MNRALDFSIFRNLVTISKIENSLINNFFLLHSKKKDFLVQKNVFLSRKLLFPIHDANNILSQVKIFLRPVKIY